jgi:hypothetical protein
MNIVNATFLLILWQLCFHMQKDVLNRLDFSSTSNKRAMCKSACTYLFKKLFKLISSRKDEA